MEKILQYAWQHRLWSHTELVTNDGRKIRVIDPGLPNSDSGPDFFNAKLMIGNDMWAGNVEIHTRASDWFRHNHQHDMAYDSVILHVVEKDDCEITRANGQVIPQCCMKISPLFFEKYAEFTSSKSEVACGAHISKFPQLQLNDWIDSLAYERVLAKADRVLALIESFSGSWEDACYITLARSLGFGINNDAFERLARRTPMRLVNKHSDSIFQIEAILFGQAGMLNPINYRNNEYYQHLCREYAFLANKFSLQPLDETTWKFFRIRPQNFPYRRIALLAQLMYGGFRLMNKLLECKDTEELRSALTPQLTGYWMRHYTFDGADIPAGNALSIQATDILIINTVVPLYYAYGDFIGKNEYCNRAFEILEDMRPEHNSITESFTRLGVKCRNAFTSQALIQLRREYCEPRKCIYCRIGHRLLSATAAQA